MNRLFVTFLLIFISIAAIADINKKNCNYKNDLEYGFFLDKTFKKKDKQLNYIYQKVLKFISEKEAKLAVKKSPKGLDNISRS